MRSSSFAVGFLGAIVLMSACSSKNDAASAGHHAGQVDSGMGVLFGSGGAKGGGGASNSGGGSASTSAGSSASGSDAGPGPNGCQPSADSMGCVGEMYAGETIPLDIYIMFDQSGSMINPEAGGVTRLDAVRTAVGQFLQDPKSAGMGVGIGYFGYKPIGQTTCDPADYQNADVPVGVLPGNAQAIIDSLAARQPTGETPTGAAIRGACTYAKQWKTDHPGHETVILLVTDGKPEAPVTCGKDGTGPCCPTLPDAVAAATDCKNGTPGLKTYVLGVGPLLDNLGQIATAGGTDQAYLVSGSAISSDQVLAALNAIRASAQIPCDLKLPPPPAGQTLDTNLVNIVYTTNTCSTEVITYRDSIATCDSTGGWYFDDPAAPQVVHLCGSTCDQVAIPGGQLMFSVGCKRPTPR